MINASPIATRTLALLKTAPLQGYGRTEARLRSSKTPPGCASDPLWKVLAVEHETDVVGMLREQIRQPFKLAEPEQRHRQGSDRQTGIASLQAFHRPYRYAHSRGEVRLRDPAPPARGTHVLAKRPQHAPDCG